jgi:hypothetical protein
VNFVNFHVADSGGMQSVVSEMAATLFIAESLSGEYAFRPQWTGIACDVSVLPACFTAFAVA